jgi:plastocyanin
MNTAPAFVLVAMLALGACGDDDTGGAPSSAPDEVGVEIVDFAFDPVEVIVPAGSTVEFTNGDDFAHSAEADDGGFDTGRIEGGATGAVAFDEAGTYSYHCGIHTYMTGAVTVTG